MNTNIVISTEKEDSKAVGSTMYVQVEIDGVPVEAMVDTEAQSTIISLSLLHRITRCLKEAGKTPPKLEIPSACLIGKDEAVRGSKLVVTAQLNVTIGVDGDWVSLYTNACSAYDYTILLVRHERPTSLRLYFTKV